MGYFINPAALGSMFAVPGDVVDRHLKMAGSAQLKALLWLCRHAGEDCRAEDLAKALGLTAADAADAMQYWLENGVAAEGGIAAAEPPKPDPAPEEEPRRACPVMTPSKPTTQDIARRGTESPDLRFLFNQAQLMLSRTLSYNDQCTLLWMHDHYGLPVSVILMAIQYSAGEGKTGINYIEKVARSWAEQEIDTIEKAEAKIERIQKNNGVWNKLRGLTGMPNPRPTAKQAEFLDVWTRQWRFSADVIYKAYEECVNNTGKLSFSYMNKVLENWRAGGVSTGGRASRAAAKPEAAAGGRRAASYDLEAFKQKSLSEPIIYRKEGK